MPEKNFQPGAGTVYTIGSTPTTINGVRQIALPDDRREQIDFTGNNDASEEFVSGPIKQSNEFTLQINYDPADTGHNLLITSVGTRQPMSVTTKDKAGVAKWTYTFDVNVASRTFPPHGVNEPARLDVTFRPCGPITRAAAAGP